MEVKDTKRKNGMEVKGHSIIYYSVVPTIGLICKVYSTTQ